MIRHEELAMGGWWLMAVGFVAGACTTFSLVPQVLKAWRSADREAISKRTYVVSTAAYALWIVHGVMIGSSLSSSSTRWHSCSVQLSWS
jgi:uncharacterized protein with PQ loop repeat